MQLGMLIINWMNPKYAQILTSLKNSSHDQILQYPQEAIQTATQELAQVYNDLKDFKKEESESADATELEKTFLRGRGALKVDIVYRIKRFLLILHEQRCNKIKDQFWEFGGELNKNQLGNLSDKEKGFLLEYICHYISYKKLVNNYIEDIGLEVTLDIDPPIDNLIEVEVINECELANETLSQGSLQFMQRRLVEKLVQRGDVVVIK